MDRQAFEQALVAHRASLHRYCARMTGTSIDGEDVVQDVMARAIAAFDEGIEIENVQGWLFRVAHNAAVDFTRARHRRSHADLADFEDLADSAGPEPATLALSFQTFQQLPELPRAAVILKDVLGHSTEEVAQIVGTGAITVKAALQRGRASLRLLADRQAEGVLLPAMTVEERHRIADFVQKFRAGDFDGIRKLLADDVQLDLVARLNLKGKEKTSVYFGRYAELDHWRFGLGSVDGHPAMLVFDARERKFEPSHYVALAWRDGRISLIRDTLFAPYSLEGASWLLLEDMAHIGGLVQ